MTSHSFLWLSNIPSCVVVVIILVSMLCLTLCNPRDWNFPGKKTGVGCYFLLQGISLIQGSSLHLLHWQADSITTEQPGNPLYISIIHLKFPLNKMITYISKTSRFKQQQEFTVCPALSKMCVDSSTRCCPHFGLGDCR